MQAVPRDPFRSAVEWVDADVLVDLVARWDEETVGRARTWVREQLGMLPLPVNPCAAVELYRRRTRLEILLGAIELRDGDPDRLTEAARRQWVNGASHVVYLRLLYRVGRREHATRLALSLLEESTGDLGDVRSLLVRTLGLPAGTEERIDAIVAAPDVDRWLDLVRFWPAADREFRIRYAVVRLLGADVAPETIFRLVATEGPTSPVVDLVERGVVDPSVVVEFASELRRDERAAFLGLAARAAAARSSSFLAARLLCESRALGRSAESLDADVAYVRAHLDASFGRVLAASGFGSPRPISS